MKKFPIILILIAFLVLAIPNSLFAADIFLPTLNNGTPELPDWLDPDSPNPGDITPTPEPPTLRDGTYGFSNDRVDISFHVTDSGSTVDFGSFYVKSPDQMHFLCNDGAGYFSDSVGITNQSFRMVSLRDMARLYAKTPVMKCDVMSETQAECSVFDPWAAPNFSYQGCGRASATVYWQH